MLKLYKVRVRTKTPGECVVIVAGKDVEEAVVTAGEGRGRWLKILQEVDGQFYAITAVEVDPKDHDRELEKTAWSSVDEPGEYRCPGCGGNRVEAPASVDLNTDEIVSFEECAENWCPDCEDTFKHICHVDKDGRCTFHNQPFLKCREDAA